MLYLFDLDGTLIEGFLERDPETGKYLDPLPYERVVLLPGRFEKLASLALEGRARGAARTRFAICTNQGGVAFGQQTEAEVYAKLGLVTVAFQGWFRAPVSFHACFTHPHAKLPEYKAEDSRRKPGAGMLLEALDAHGVEMRCETCAGTGSLESSDSTDDSWWDCSACGGTGRRADRAVFVGDMTTDEEAADAAGVRYIDAGEFFEKQIDAALRGSRGYDA